MPPIERPSIVLAPLAVALAVAVAPSAMAATLLVPAAYPTIQAAINASSDGDLILVAPGVYVETLEYHGKSIEVRTPVPGTATIDANHAGTAVKIGGDVGPAAKLSGFLILNGNGVNGGGLSITGSPTIEYCAVLNCSAVEGGGAYVVGNAQFSHCGFFDCTATGNGGGVRSDGAISFTACGFQGNEASGGGGIAANGLIGIDACLFTENSAAIGSELALLSGGGLIEATSFIANGAGAAIDTVGDLAILSSSVDGGGIGVAGHATGSPFLLTINNCTIANQSSAAVEVTSARFSALALVANSILWGAPDAIRLTGRSAFASVARSDVQGGWPGVGNIDSDPLFVDPSNGDFGLRPGSPCLDAGSNELVPNSLVVDALGQDRFANHPAAPDVGVPGGIGGIDIVDIGAVEGNPKIRYVNATASGANTGMSWTDAYTDLQDALDDGAAGHADYVFVAAGGYRPDRGTNDRAASFALASGMHVAGGFLGGERELAEANPIANQTILTGAIGGITVNDNSYHVLRADNVDATGVLDGFIVQRGRAYGSGSFEDRGAGLLIDGGGPTIRRAWFRLNESAGNGAGVHSRNADAHFDRCRFNLNVSQADAGAIAFVGGDQALTNSLVHGNEAKENGAIRIIDEADVTITNVTVAGNASLSDVGGGISVGPEGTLTLRNALLWANVGVGGTVEQNQLQVSGFVAVGGSSVQGWTGFYGGLLNNGNDPLFADPLGSDNQPGSADDDYRLSDDSPAIDSAMSGALPEATFALDLDDAPRYVDDPSSPNLGTGASQTLDRGAYEFAGTPCATDLNGDAITNAADLAILLGAWGGAGEGDVDGSGSVDAADLAILLGAWGAC